MSAPDCILAIVALLLSWALVVLRRQQGWYRISMRVDFEAGEATLAIYQHDFLGIYRNENGTLGLWYRNWRQLGYFQATSKEPQSAISLGADVRPSEDKEP